MRGVKGFGCIVEGCDAPHASLGYCKKHYSRVRRNGHTDLVNVRPLCSVGGCNKPHSGNSFCKMHWERVRRYGDPSIVHKRGPSRMAARVSVASTGTVFLPASIQHTERENDIVHVECCRFPVTLCGVPVETDWTNDDDDNCVVCHYLDWNNVCPLLGECQRRAS